MACANPSGCDCMDHNTDCVGCYWYRSTDENKKKKDEDDKDA